MTKYTGHDWVVDEKISEPLLQGLDDGARDAAQAVEDLAVSAAATYLPLWKPNTAYLAAAIVVNPSGQIVRRKADGVSSATYDASAWDIVAGGSGGGSAVSSVAGRIGDVTLTKTDVGLGNVSNTADADKPVSSATQTALNAKADASALAGKADASALAGKADLVGGVISTSQIPTLALNTVVPVASRAAMLALTSSQVQPGDVAVDTSTGSTRGSYMLLGTDSSQLANWILLTAPTDVVTSVNGQTGPVVLGKADVGLGNVDNTSDADKPVSTPQQAALDAKLGTAPSALTVSPDGVSKAGIWTALRGHPTLPAPSKVITRFASGHGWTSGTDDTSVRYFGVDRTYRGITNGAGGSLYLSSPSTLAIDASTSVLRIILSVDDPTKMLTNQIYVDTGTGNGFVANMQGNYSAGEFAVITLPRSIFTANTGTPTWSNVTGIRLRFQDKSTGAITVRVTAVELLPDLASRNPSGTFVLECDDGFANQFSVLRPLTDSLGIPVTFNPIARRIINGAAGMTMVDLQSLHDRSGWQISCHGFEQTTHDYAPNGQIPAAMLEADFQNQKQWLHANGLHDGADDFSLCPGTSTGFIADSNPLMPVLRRNFRSARTVNGYVETNGFADPHRVRSLLFTGQTTGSLQTNVDWTAGAGGVFVFALHDVLTGSTNGTSNSLPAIAINNLATLLAYAASKGMQFRTRGQVAASSAVA